MWNFVQNFQSTGLPSLQVTDKATDLQLSVIDKTSEEHYTSKEMQVHGFMAMVHYAIEANHTT